MKAELEDQGQGGRGLSDVDVSPKKVCQSSQLRGYCNAAVADSINVCRLM